MDTTFKHIVFQKCQDLLSEKMNALQTEIKELVDQASNDSKSSAGDKHETGRAMMQQEQAHLGKLLSALEQQKSIIDKLNHQFPSQVISDGSLVFTSDKSFYIAIPLGRILAGEQEVHVISAESPLGAKLKGKKIGDNIEMNGVTHHIKSVF